MGRDDSWPATVPSVVPTGDCSQWSIHKANRPISLRMAKVPTRKHPEWRNRTSGRKSDGTFWILVKFSFYLNYATILVNNKIKKNTESARAERQ